MAGGEGKRGSSGKAFVVAGMVVAAPLLTVVVVLLCLVILVVAILQSDYGLGTPLRDGFLVVGGLGGVGREGR